MKSLELNWIKNVDKSLVIPEVVFVNTEFYEGKYHLPEKEVIIEEQEYDCRFGIIELSIHSATSPEEILAHEWRHHWQTLHGWDFTCYSKFVYTYDLDEYDKNMVYYFSKNIQELDALRFELMYAPKTHPYFEELYYTKLCR